MRREASSAIAIRIVNLDRVPGAGIKAFPCNLQEVYSAIFGPGPAVGCEEGSFLGAGKLARPGLGESQSVQRVVGGMVEEEPAGVVRDGLVQVRAILAEPGTCWSPLPAALMERATRRSRGTWTSAASRPLLMSRPGTSASGARRRESRR
jgi:hypothetical protein